MDANEPVLVKAQNVYDYFIAHYKEHGWGDLRSFSCARPPFQKMVITYDHSFKSRPGSPFHVDLLLSERTREHLLYYTTPESDAFQNSANDAIRSELAHIMEVANPDFGVEVKIAFDTVMLPGRWFVLMNKNGQVLTVGEVGWVYVSSPQEQEAIVKEGWSLEGLQNAFCEQGAIGLATLSFMNCRNVKVEDHPPSRQQRRAAERQGKKPPVVYKTLQIIPVKGRSLSASDGVALSRNALHIVRGHFKDFRSGLGLGKGHVHGVWWWHPQVRGSAEGGRVEKDYEVETRDKEGETV